MFARTPCRCRSAVLEVMPDSVDMHWHVVGSQAIPRRKRSGRQLLPTRAQGDDMSVGADRQVEVVDTFAEAFPMTAARAIVTADTPAWAATAARVMTGYATSVISCDAEAGIERTLQPAD